MPIVVGQLPVRGVAQQQPLTAGDHRRIGLGHPELFEQQIDLRVGLHVHPGEEHAVLGQEVADPEGIGGVARADHPQADEVGRLMQKLPPGDERLENDVADVRALVQDLSQSLPRNLVHLAIATGDGANHPRIAGQVRDVAGELALPMDRDCLRFVAGVIDDLDLARLDDEEVEVAVADRKERLPVPIQLKRGAGATGQFGDLGLVERRKGDRLKVVFGHTYFSAQL